MTCDERIEKTLNRAGQTISDLPKDYSDVDCMRAYAAVQEWRSENNLSTQHECEKYILHLTDVIDRMETALENVCGERDYMRSKCCFLCGLRDESTDIKTCEECEVGKGVPDDWWCGR